MKDNEIEVKFKMILDLIYNERIAQKYTQKDIAEYLNIKTNTYSLIENGKQKLLLLDLIKISRFLKLDSRISEILESNSHNSGKIENFKNDSKNDNFNYAICEDFIIYLKDLGRMHNTIVSIYSSLLHMYRKMNQSGYKVDLSFNDYLINNRNHIHMSFLHRNIKKEPEVLCFLS